jgi:alpha-mannosidase
MSFDTNKCALHKGGLIVKRFNTTAQLLSIFLVIMAVCAVLAQNLATEEVVYEIPGAHLDTQWQWDLATTVNTYLPSTLNTNFAYFTQYPEYKFNFEGAFRYWLIKKMYPANYTTLKQYIASGQWRVCGGGAEPGDVNIPSAEAMIRNYLYGNQFFMDEFGKRSIDIYLPDCFGFGYALPTIAAHCGLTGFRRKNSICGAGGSPRRFPSASGTALTAVMLSPP